MSSEIIMWRTVKQLYAWNYIQQWNTIYDNDCLEQVSAKEGRKSSL